jgi:hypothetical protein
MDVKRNPVILPERREAPRGTHCPHCNSTEYTGRNLGGVVAMKCKKCGKDWQGGVPATPQDPREPIPYEKPGPLTFVGERNKDGDVVKIHEIRQRADPTQTFRRGAPIDSEES